MGSTKGVHRGLGGSHLHGAAGVGAHAVSSLRKRGAAQGLCLHQPWPGMGGPWGQEQWDPLVLPHSRGVPAQDTHTLAFLPLAAGGARQTSLTLPTLEERGDVGNETGRECPHVHSSWAGMLQAQPKVHVATFLLEPGSLCAGGEQTYLWTCGAKRDLGRKEKGALQCPEPLQRASGESPIPAMVTALSTPCPQVPPQEPHEARGVSNTQTFPHLQPEVA